jgi:DNA processing protein
MLESNRRVLWHLSLIDGVGPVTIIRILNALVYQNSPDLLHVELIDYINRKNEFNLTDLYNYTVNDFEKKLGLPYRLASLTVKGLADKTLLEKEISLANRYNVKIASLLDDTYPEVLMQIKNPPIIIYFTGQPLNSMSKGIAIVGSRKADKYAREVIDSLIPSLVSNGWQIISGGAEGADTMAHKATLDAGGQTVVVLGSGLMCPYPESNRELFRNIATTGGTVISAFSLQTAPDRGNFPARNRIISGLSLGCIVVRAAEKSGALITAKYALEQGRVVFAVPGKVSDELSKGCHDLLKQGAKLVEQPNDIFEEFGEYISVQTTFTPAKIGPTKEVSAKKTAQPIVCEQLPSDPVLGALGASCTTDELSYKTGLELAELQDRLFELQLEGKIRQNYTGSWERVI